MALPQGAEWGDIRVEGGWVGYGDGGCSQKFGADRGRRLTVAALPRLGCQGTGENEQN
jgi:hypothetical protein